VLNITDTCRSAERVKLRKQQLIAGETVPLCESVLAHLGLVNNNRRPRNLSGLTKPEDSISYKNNYQLGKIITHMGILPRCNIMKCQLQSMSGTLLL